jgi:hypothetical protein
MATKQSKKVIKACPFLGANRLVHGYETVKRVKKNKSKK